MRDNLPGQTRFGPAAGGRAQDGAAGDPLKVARPTSKEKVLPECGVICEKGQTNKTFMPVLLEALSGVPA